MADSNISITSGSGVEVDTRTEATNGHHRQVIVIGDPATNAGVAPVDATAGLKVDLGADNDVTVTGTVDLGATDNAVLDAIAASVAAIDTDATTIIGHVDGLEGLIGTTNTNTAASTTALQIIDDWDESDRAKVNIIVGQAGVTAGAGSVAANTPRVTLASDSPDVTHLATIAGDTTAIETAIQIMDDWDNGASDGASVSGDVAHDTADAGEPVKIGMKAVALKANPTEVAAGDRTNWYADVSGVPFVLGGHPNILTQGLQVTDADGAQTDAAIITAGANVAVVVTKVSVMADEANTGGVSVRIGFGTANTPAADAAQTLLFHPGIAPGSGVVEGTGSGILGIGASGEDVRVTCEDPAGGSVSIIVTYFTTDI